MTAYGRSPAAWVSALFASLAMTSTGGAVLASPTEPMTQFSPMPSLDRYAAVTDLDKLPVVSPDRIPSPLAYSVCSESTTWARPSTDEQTIHLQADPRYSELLDSATAQTLKHEFWETDAIAFTSYGLSARQEPIYFSGLWSLLEQEPALSQCYDAERIAQINSGQIAELWLIGHQVQSVQWVGDRYVIRVSSVDTGVQFVQFPRREAFATLPIQLVTEDDISLNVVSVNPLNSL